MKIEKATLQDAAAILNLQKLAFQSEAELHNDFHISPLLESIDDYKAGFNNYHYLKAVFQGLLVGSVRGRLTDDNRLLIGRLIVHPDYQGRGIGKSLMGQIEDEFRGVSHFELFTAEISVRNMTFYKKLGYEITDKFREPANEKITLVVFRKKPSK